MGGAAYRRPRSPVQVIAAAAVVRREPEQLTPRYGRPSLAGEVLDLASQPAIIAAITKARDGAGERQCRAFI
jgi:hypothetical protein